MRLFSRTGTADDLTDGWHMRSILRIVFACLTAVACVACPSGRPDFIECRDETSCGLANGGLCVENASTGHQFCAYPDPACEGSGLRWSDLDVEDGASGVCVPSSAADAGVPDATRDTVAPSVLAKTPNDG